MQGMNNLVKRWTVGLATLLLASCSSGGTDSEDVDCAQVLVWARGGGAECQSFATPCDVPDGYVQCCGGLFGGCLVDGDATTCVDDPTDSCNRGSGGTDCPGICQ